jgi:ankyrin repeat protein
MSEWDDFDPEQKRRVMLDDPEKADQLIAADRRLIAAMNKNPIDIEGLRSALTDDACPDRIIINGLPALHVAIHKHDIKALDLLLRHAARTDDWDIEGATAMDEAYRKRFHEGIKLLKLFNAEPRIYGEPGHDKADDVYAPSYEMRMNQLLLKMIRFGTAKQVAQAIELGADVNMRPTTGQAFWPPLHVAVAQCELDKVKVLVEAGADLFAHSSRGQEVCDVQWETPGAKLLSTEWDEIFDYLKESGYNNLFLKHPRDFTLNDLRQTLPLSEDRRGSGNKSEIIRPRTMLHHLVVTGHEDIVFNVLERNPNDHLTAQDFLTRSDRDRKTLLEACGDAGLLAKIFSSDIWQDRLEEMMSLRPHVEKTLYMRNKVDFNKAAVDVRARRLQELKRKAPKIQLKRN